MKSINPRFLASMFSLIALSFIWMACSKEKNTTTTTNPAQSLARVQSFYLENVPEIQAFQLNAANFSEVEGKKGTKIGVPPNAFMTTDGKVVSGAVTFQLQELRSAADMILAQKQTSSGGKLLASGGEFYLNAQQAGQDLLLAPGKELAISVPTENFTPEMMLFTGSGEGENFDWVPDSTTTVSECKDSSTFNFSGYCFNLDSLINWINCDYFNNDPRPLTDVEIQVPAGYTDVNTTVMIYVPSINSMVNARYNNGSFYINGGYQMPVGLAVTFIGIHDDGANFWYSIQNATIVNNHIEILSFQIISQAQLLALLQSI